MIKIITEKTRDKLAEYYIKWGSKFSFLKIEPFVTFENLRQSQSKLQDKQAKNQVFPPSNFELDLIYFRLVEIYHLEDFDRLTKGLQKLFPNLEDSFLHGKFRSEFFHSPSKIHGGQWINIGIVARERKMRLFAGDVRYLPSLPKEVDFISVELNQILPSTIVVVLDVHLTEIVTQRLKELRSKDYHPKIRFRHIIPTGPGGGGFSKSIPEYDMRDEILNYLEGVRSSIEMSLKPFINGYFMKQKNIENIHLPAIEVYSFENIPASKSASLKWIQASRVWLRTIGFNFFSFSIFSDRSLFFIPWDEGESFSNKNRLSHQLIVSSTPYLKKIDLNMHQNNKKSTIAYYTQSLLDEMLAYFSIYHILVSFQKEFETNRSMVFKSMKLRALWLGKYISLSDEVIKMSMIHDRLSKELLLEKNYLVYKLKSLEELKALEAIGKHPLKNLSDFWSGLVDYRLDILKEHISIASGWFAQYLALRNIAVTYMLAVIAGIAAIVSILLTLLK